MCGMCGWLQARKGNFTWWWWCCAVILGTTKNAELQMVKKGQPYVMGEGWKRCLAMGFIIGWTKVCICDSRERIVGKMPKFKDANFKLWKSNGWFKDICRVKGIKRLFGPNEQLYEYFTLTSRTHTLHTTLIIRRKMQTHTTIEISLYALVRPFNLKPCYIILKLTWSHEAYHVW